MCLLLGVHEGYIIGEVQTGLYMGKENEDDIIGFQCVHLYMMIMTIECTMYLVQVFKCKINVISSYFLKLLCKSQMYSYM